MGEALKGRITVVAGAGRGRGMTQLYLEVPVERQDVTLRVLSGSVYIAAGRSVSVRHWEGAGAPPSA
jgi:hypothetical protein